MGNAFVIGDFDNALVFLYPTGMDIIYATWLNDIVLAKLGTNSTSVSLNDESIASFNLYPNPTHSTVNFPFQANVVLSNFAGQTLETHQHVSTLDLQKYAAGLYFVSIEDEFHHTINRYKIIKD